MGLIGGRSPGRLSWAIGGLLGGALPALLFALLLGLDPWRDLGPEWRLWLYGLPGLIGGLSGLAIGSDLQREIAFLPLVGELRGSLRRTDGKAA